MAPVTETAAAPPKHTATQAHARAQGLLPHVSGVGGTTALAFFALSLEPSLLPRSGVFQGIVSGTSVMIGYGLGVLAQWVWGFLELPRPQSRLSRVIARTAALGVVLGIMTLSAVWRHVGWQNEVRATFGMDPVRPTVWVTIVIVTILLGSAILVAARSIRAALRLLVRLFNRRLPHRLSILLGTTALLFISWWVFTGVMVSGAFAAANQVFSVRDADTAPGVVQPASPLRSGGPGSLVAWDTLGKQGRSFVAGGPTVATLDAFSGGGAVEPIRVYAGLESADTLQERALLVLDELKRTGAFEREILVVATTTGTGWLDPNAMDPLEYLYNGDTAIAGLQYSYLPSSLSLLADQEVVKETSRVVFDIIHDHWSTLPASTRPRIYLFGMSLGSLGVESVLSTLSIINAPIDGALLVGPPFLNPLHSDIVADRDPGSPPWLPIYENGRTVRFTTEQNALDIPTAHWGRTRVVYLQHASDPIVFFSTDLAFRRPEWLATGRRGPEIPSRMTWVPLVTMAQVAADIVTARSVPVGFGHVYSPAAYIDAWVGVTDPPGWAASDTERLKLDLAALATATAG